MTTLDENNFYVGPLAEDTRGSDGGRGPFGGSFFGPSPEFLSGVTWVEHGISGNAVALGFGVEAGISIYTPVGGGFWQSHFGAHISPSVGPSLPVSVAYVETYHMIPWSKQGGRVLGWILPLELVTDSVSI